jgi:hypothetical protein
MTPPTAAPPVRRARTLLPPPELPHHLFINVRPANVQPLSPALLFDSQDSTSSEVYDIAASPADAEPAKNLAIQRAIAWLNSLPSEA